MKRVVMQAVGSTDPGTLLLTEHARLSAEDRVLVLSAGDPALILNAGRRTASVAVYDISYRAIQRAQEQVIARLSDAPITFSDGVFPDAEDGFDVALMAVPKGRDFARAQLWSALKALRPGGRLYIAGPTRGGAKSVLDDAAVLFGHSVTLNTKRRYRVGVAVRPEQSEALAYPTEWGADPTFVQRRVFETPRGPIPVATMPGIFSWERLDDGTAFLMEHVAFEPGQDVLDVSSGSGVLGIAAALSDHASGRVTLTDDNLLAVRCARASVAINALSNVSVQPGDVYSGLGGQRFDLIISNPPFHKTFDVNTNVAHRIMREAKDHLRPGGRLVIVANAFLKYEDVMAAHLPKARVLARNNRYIVIEGRRG